MRAVVVGGLAVQFERYQLIPKDSVLGSMLREHVGAMFAMLRAGIIRDCQSPPLNFDPTNRTPEMPIVLTDRGRIIIDRAHVKGYCPIAPRKL